MELFALLVFAVLASVFVSNAEDEWERKGQFCKNCGTQLLDCDDCCIICGTPAESCYVNCDNTLEQVKLSDYCPKSETDWCDYNVHALDSALCDFCSNGPECEYYKSAKKFVR